ncbi:HDOD domain-containing protein [Lampropedia aestuarii]|nr:HDOD domain-containing protein [Lampropedia aestuarii]
MLPFFAGSLAFLHQELLARRPRMERINQGFANEPVLSTRLLFLANQQWPQSCLHVSSALALLSLDDVREALSARLGSPYANGVHADSHYVVWRRYSIQVARVARSLARDLYLNEQLAYSAGLLHAIHMLMPQVESASDIQPKQTQPSDLALLREQAFPLFGLLLNAHCFKKSAALMRQWQLPDGLSDVIKDCEKPFDDEIFRPLAAVLHLAIWRVCIASLGAANSTLAYPAEIALSLGMDMDMVLHQEPIRWK